MKNVLSNCVVIVGLFSSVGIASTEELPPVARPGSGGYISGELIYQLEGRQTPECHASTIAETPSGLVAAWFGGKHERNPDVGVWVSRRRAAEWSKAVEVVDGSEGEDQDYPCWNPVLFQPKNGPLMLFYKVGPRPDNWWGMLTTSADDGATWSEPWKLGDHEEIGHLIGPVKNKPVQLADGSILCPSSTEHKGWRVHFEVTRDFGKIWEVIGPINDASNYNAIQPSILTYPDGRMQVLCRTREKVIAQSWSKDGGWSWGPLTATHLPNPNAGTDALTLFDGRQLLVYNHSVREGDRNGRQILNVGLSNDGEKWKPVLTLENEGNAAGYSYPAVIQDSDGQVHITYTWRRLSVKHVILDPDQLR